MTLGEKLKELREASGLSQKDVAVQIKRAKQMVSLYENDVNRPPFNMLEKLAIIYNTPLTELVQLSLTDTTKPEASGNEVEYINFQALIKEKYDTVMDLITNPTPEKWAAEKDKQQAIIDQDPVLRARDQTMRAKGKALVEGKSVPFAYEGKAIPFYEVDVFASNVETFNDMQHMPSAYLKLPGILDCDFSCRVSGDSMINKINPGSIIACREVKDKDLIQFGDIFLIITAENRWIKIVRKHSNPDLLLLKSQNPDYDDIDCPKEKVLQMFAVKVIVNQEQM